MREAHVRDSLATCLHKIEPALTFVDKEAKIPSSIGTTSFLDLLATDSSGRYVIVEVKRTDAATREAAHEILKYIEGVKAHLGLREHELRVIVASVEWRELIVPFSSFVHRTDCQVEGFKLDVDDAGAVLSAHRVEPLPIHSDRVVAPWHELRFYKDEAALEAGIADHERCCAAKSISSYFLVILDAPAGHPDGYPSTKQVTNRGLIAEMAASMGRTAKDIPDELYKSAIYFVMQQLTRQEYIDRLPRDAEATSDTMESIAEMEEEEALLTLHEAVLDLDPSPKSSFFEIGTPAKFRSRLLEEEGWQVRKIIRYGAFERNAILADETILEEIGGSQGNSQQSMKLAFRPSQKAELAEARRRINTCLRDNDPWRAQLNLVLDELANSGEQRECYLQVMNPLSALTTVYLAASREDGPLYVPTYQLRVPSEDTERMYFGVLQHNGSRPYSLGQVLDEFYEGDKFRLLFTLQWGGYEVRDVKIVRKLGLRYKTYQCEVVGAKRAFKELDDHEWEPCSPISHLDAYYSFLNDHPQFVRDVCELYSSHWDGRMVFYNRED